MKTTRRSFNRSLVLGGAGLWVSSACVRGAPLLQATPPQAAPGILPAAAEEGIVAVLEGGRLHLSYQLTQAAAERLKSPGLSWVQATIVVAINSFTQAPVCRPLAAASSLESKGPFPIEGGVRWEATVDPRELLGLGEASGLWFLHASALQYRSGVLALELTG